MEEKVVLITGSSRGLGLEMAKKFKNHAKKVIITGRDEQVLKQVSSDLGDNVYYECLDFEKMEDAYTLVNNIIKKHGQIDVLINNAGMHLKKDFLDFSDAEYRKVIQVNQESVFILSREFAREMVKHKQGVILNISSMAAIYGLPKVIAYTAAKSAIEGMTRAMAVELSPLGIRVNCIAPGFIKTDMLSNAMDNDPKRKSRVLERTPMGYLGEPDDIAEAAYFLCSEKAKYITGVVLPVDGGNSISF